MSKSVIDTERLQRGQKNRQIQLQRWNFLETEYQKSQTNSANVKKIKNHKNIVFAENIILLEAISRNDITEVKELLMRGVDPNCSTVDSLTGLHQCCIDDFQDMAALLIEYNANVNSVDSENWTPLHAAATCGNGPMCILLSKNGANLLAMNSDGNMPYDICEGTDTLKILEGEMSRKGITQQQIDDTRMMPENMMLQDIKILIQQKKNLNELDSQGAALIHIASCLGYSEVVQTLLEAGANYSLPDKDGWQPTHLAAGWNNADIVELLVVFGADIDKPNVSGDSVFDLCDTETRGRLLYLRDNLAEIKKTYNFSRLPTYKGFRRSRGSSVRRTSVRQKNILSKKEAKDEFIILTTTMSAEDGLQQNDQEMSKHIPTTIEEGSDVDISDINVRSPRVTIHSLDHEKTTTQRPTSNNQSSSMLPASNGTTPAPPTKQIQPSVQFQEQKDITPRRASLLNIKTNSEVEALDKPRYVFTSTSEDWGNADHGKRRRSGKCCVLL